MGVLGCNADGENVECRYCGLGEYSDVHCRASQVCNFDNVPTTPYYYDPDCVEGMLGCKADLTHVQCRFCGVGSYASVPCPEPYVWDDSCASDAGQVGCRADNIHVQCRFCGLGDYVACPTRRLDSDEQSDIILR